MRDAVDRADREAGAIRYLQPGRATSLGTVAPAGAAVAYTHNTEIAPEVLVMRRFYSLLTCLALLPLLLSLGGCLAIYGDPDDGDELAGERRERVTEPAVREALQANGEVDTWGIDIDIEGTSVFLSGEVPEKQQIAIAHETVRNVRGVSSVHSEELRVIEDGD